MPRFGVRSGREWSDVIAVRDETGSRHSRFFRFCAGRVW